MFRAAQSISITYLPWVPNFVNFDQCHPIPSLPPAPGNHHCALCFYEFGYFNSIFEGSKGRVREKRGEEEQGECRQRKKNDPWRWGGEGWGRMWREGKREILSQGWEVPPFVQLAEATFLLNETWSLWMISPRLGECSQETVTQAHLLVLNRLRWEHIRMIFRIQLNWLVL